MRLTRSVLTSSLVFIFTSNVLADPTHYIHKKLNELRDSSFAQRTRILSHLEEPEFCNELGKYSQTISEMLNFFCDLEKPSLGQSSLTENESYRIEITTKVKNLDRFCSSPSFKHQEATQLLEEIFEMEESLYKNTAGVL